MANDAGHNLMESIRRRVQGRSLAHLAAALRDAALLLEAPETVSESEDAATAFQALGYACIEHAKSIRAVVDRG